MKRLVVFLVVIELFIGGIGSAEATSVFQDGGDRLVAKQNSDGGWGWPLTGSSASNTIGPIGMGLAQAYLNTGDPDQLSRLGFVSSFLLAKTEFSPSDGYLAATLDQIFGVTTYTAYVKTNFYDKLAAGTYDRGGTYYDTATYVYLIRTNRAGNQANMAAWDIGMGIVGAASVGADTTAWINGTEAEINELDGNNYYDVIGLAGGIYGLAFVNENIDPTAGAHAAANSLSDLAAILASYQINSGGFTWNSGYVTAGNETVQETAYSILALNEVGGYQANIQGAANYLRSVQLSTGGWENYLGDGENNEVTGEAIWGVSAVPEPATMILLGLGLVGLAGIRRKFNI